MENRIKYIFAILITICHLSCKKDWLEEKRSISVIVPTTLQDLRLMLNNDEALTFDSRGITEVGVDDIYVTDEMFATNGGYERNALIWSKDIWGNNTNIYEWEKPYHQVLIANVILEALDKIVRTTLNAIQYDNIKGAALYIRSRAFLNLAMTFAKYYDQNTSNTDLGIPIKLSSDINEKVTRQNVEQTYIRISQDLITASQLLPEKALLKTDPSKAAAFGLLARCYLFMDKYDLALQAANSSYSLQSYLIDFNTLDVSSTRPIPDLSDEMQIYSVITTSFLTVFSGYSNIDEDLYNSYSSNDLRKTIFFTKRSDGGIHFKGTYSRGGLFGSTATDEILLIRAECKARLDDKDGAMVDLNTLLIKRFRTNTHIPLTAMNSEEALEIILKERRKELIRRGIRWQDLKRLNRDSRFAKTLTKTIAGTIYTLPPNDPRYVMPIPSYVIQFNNIPQNIR